MNSKVGVEDSALPRVLLLGEENLNEVSPRFLINSFQTSAVGIGIWRRGQGFVFTHLAQGRRKIGEDEVMARIGMSG